MLPLRRSVARCRSSQRGSANGGLRCRRRRACEARWGEYRRPRTGAGTTTASCCLFPRSQGSHEGEEVACRLHNDAWARAALLGIRGGPHGEGVRRRKRLVRRDCSFAGGGGLGSRLRRLPLQQLGRNVAEGVFDVVCESGMGDIEK